MNLRPMLLAILAASLPGCTDGFDRQPVSGTVSYRGVPVPAGVVYFEPDESVGSLAPTGFAKIVEGRFATSFGEGCVPGKHLVRVAGFDGGSAPLPRGVEGEMTHLNPALRENYGAPLFPQYTFEVTLSEDPEPLTIVAPDVARADSSRPGH